ncbi:hypothetical protein B0H63DRAFT_451528 [Podospora didyma]|uniref:Uncharacterized protein n=1 Tax=Podospora didyma TaxID=330526 RepID=A0AAE0NBW7_9PEZI|nr:hypothetical protein B0H63DRAFT_451528 [Podospora didyma]
MQEPLEHGCPQTAAFACTVLLGLVSLVVLVLSRHRVDRNGGIFALLAKAGIGNVVGNRVNDETFYITHAKLFDSICAVHNLVVLFTIIGLFSHEHRSFGLAFSVYRTLSEYLHTFRQGIVRRARETRAWQRLRLKMWSIGIFAASTLSISVTLFMVSWAMLVALSTLQEPQEDFGKFLAIVCFTCLPEELIWSGYMLWSSWDKWRREQKANLMSVTSATTWEGLVES